MTTPVAPFNGQAIGLAHYASRAALERVLARSGTTFEQSVALRAAAFAAVIAWSSAERFPVTTVAGPTYWGVVESD